MKKHEFVTPGLFPGVTADQAVEELERIREKRGILTPGIIVDESRGENALLHKCFQWDDTKAAALYREEQARTLIRNIRCVVEITEISYKTRTYVNVSTVEGSPRSYLPIDTAMSEDYSRADLLNQAKEDARKFITKYNTLEQLNKVKEEMLLFIND